MSPQAGATTSYLTIWTNQGKNLGDSLILSLDSVPFYAIYKEKSTVEYEPPNP
jgi:hypothetical protein